MGIPPSIDVLLAEWWGGGVECLSSNIYDALVSNIVVGGNPPYQISDFLAFFPKFGIFAQALQAAVPNAVGGAGYAVNDILNVTQPGASGGQVKVTAVAGGVPTAYAIQAAGTGYSLAVGVSTSAATGVGAGALIDITNLVPSANMAVPTAVIQTYINLATASLSSARWFDSWLLGMHFFVAHYCTLYLDSEGNPGSTPGQVAVSGMGKGILVSKAAGDVSGGYQPVIDEDWLSWNLTKYGQQLVSMAKIIGMGPMYVR
jgi:hypothetical protein